MFGGFRLVEPTPRLPVPRASSSEREVNPLPSLPAMTRLAGGNKSRPYFLMILSRRAGLRTGQESLGRLILPLQYSTGYSCQQSLPCRSWHLTHKALSSYTFFYRKLVLISPTASSKSWRERLPWRTRSTWGPFSPLRSPLGGTASSGTEMSSTQPEAREGAGRAQRLQQAGFFGGGLNTWQS